MEVQFTTTQLSINVINQPQILSVSYNLSTIKRQTVSDSKISNDILIKTKEGIVYITYPESGPEPSATVWGTYLKRKKYIIENIQKYVKNTSYYILN